MGPVTSLPQAEFLALSRERDAELRGEGMLSLAGRQQRDTHSEFAGEIYTALLDDAELPASVRERARNRLAALHGEGSVGARAEVLISRFAEEATNPTTLLAMTLAGAAFRATRLLTLSRLAASPSAGLLTRGLGARGLAGLAGFAVEATVFPLAGRAGNLALGREQNWSIGILGRELASSFLTLGALRAGGLLTRSLAAPQRWYRPAAEQVGMFGGIVLGHQLEVQTHLREPSSGANTLIDSLAMLLQFNVAGRLNRSVGGEGLQRFERQVEAQTEAIGRLPESRWPTGLAAQPALALAGGTGAFEGPETFGPDRVFMSSENGNGNGNGNGPGRRRPAGSDSKNHTLPFITVQGQELSPYHIQHPLELTRRIRDAKYRFADRIATNNVEFQIHTIYDIEPYIVSVIDQLNRIENVPFGRRVILNVHASGEIQARRIVIERRGEGFERGPDGVSDTPPSPAAPTRGVDPLAKTIFAMSAAGAEIPANPPAPVSPSERAVEAPTTTAPRRPIAPLKPARSLPLTTDKAEEIVETLIRMNLARQPGEATPTLILEGLQFSDSSLMELLGGMAPRLPEHATFDLLDLEGGVTYNGLRLGNDVRVLQQYRQKLEWETASGRSVLPRIPVDSVAALYRQIYLLGKKTTRTPDHETTLVLEKELPPEGLADLALRGLNRYAVIGRSFRLETGDGTHEFSGENGRWRLSPTGPASAGSKPPSRPPTSGTQYHVARWRTALNQFLQEKVSGVSHEFFMISPVALTTADAQAIRQRLQSGGGEIESLRVHDQASQKVWIFQRQGEQWSLEEGIWENQTRWRAHENNPQGAVEALDLMDLVRQIPATLEGSAPLHIQMRGPWSNQTATLFVEALNQGLISTRPRLELHYEGAEGPRRQVFERNSRAEWSFLEAPEWT